MGQGLLEPPVALQPFAVAYPPASEASMLERELWKRQVTSAMIAWEVEVGECLGGFISSVEVADEGRRRLDGQGSGGKKRDSHGGHRRDRTDLCGLVTDCHHGTVTSGVAGTGVKNEVDVIGEFMAQDPGVLSSA